MLDLQALHEQFSNFQVYQAREQALMEARLERAVRALHSAAPVWPELAARARDGRPDRLLAGLRERPDATYAAPVRPSPLTLVATDGSQIYPDRHIEPTCYLLNISRIAFQYGTLERPLMDVVPYFRYRRHELDGTLDAWPAGSTEEVVSAIRDEYELRNLLDTARDARIPGRPLVALADGTLIRWMLRSMRNRELERTLIERYTQTLAGFRSEGIPVCSYISMPGNTELVNLLSLHLEATRLPTPSRDGDTPGDTIGDAAGSLEGVTDRQVFERLLGAGERTGVFESASLIQREYDPEHRICYFYVHIPLAGGAEIGRVEMPRWVAEAPALLDLVHAVVLSECDKGQGYPMILTEAHERAVIRAHERALFYEWMERQMTEVGLAYSGSRKQASKRRPTV